MDGGTTIDAYLSRIGLESVPEPVTGDEWSSLWARTQSAHRAWDEAGRP